MGIPQFLGGRRGEVVSLLRLPSSEVGKFVFDGSEEFLELPHAFFHYVTWFSGGREMAFDLQGAEHDDGDVILVDPCLLRTEKAGVSDLLKVQSSAARARENIAEQFDV